MRSLPFNILIASLVVGCGGAQTALKTTAPTPAPAAATIATEELAQEPATRIAVDTSNGTTLTGYAPAGEVVAERTIPGAWRVPTPVPGGPPEGLARNGTTVVLEPFGQSDDRSAFLLLDLTRPGSGTRIELAGKFEYDALAPDGSYLYLTQRKGHGYLIRAFDLHAHELVEQPLVDKGGDGGDTMAGVPIARTSSAAGDWIYTLYAVPGGTAFVHALVAGRLFTACIDLPRSTRGAEAGAWSIAVSGAGASPLVVADGVTGKAYVVLDRDGWPYYHRAVPLAGTATGPPAIVFDGSRAIVRRGGVPTTIAA